MRGVPVWLGLSLAGCGFAGTSGSGGSGADAAVASADADKEEADGQTIDAAVELALCDGSGGALVACFEFENVVDDSVGLVGASTELGQVDYVAGIHGQAIRLDGNDNLIVGPDADLNVTDVTFDGWIDVTTFPTGRAGVVDLESHFGVFVHPGGEIRCVLAGSGTLSSLQTTVTISEGTWHHVACRHTPGRGSELFVDGDIVACAAVANPLSTDAQPLTVGANSPDNSDRLIGSIDSVRYWGRELGDAQLCAAANQSSCQVLASGCAPP